MKNCTRFFTQEQIDEIRMRLAAINGAKDSEFDQATYIGDNDYVAIVQNGKNKKANISLLKQDIYEMDDVPTEGSSNPVKSNGIYEALQDIIEQIEPNVSKYIYIQTDSEMFDYLLNGAGGIRQQGTYNNYCNQVYEGIKNGYFILIDNALCVPLYKEDPYLFQLYCISDTKCIRLGAQKDSADVWHQISGTNSLTNSRFLIDNLYLTRNKYINQDKLNEQLNSVLEQYVKIKDLRKSTDNYPIENSNNFVTSNGVWQAIQNVINSTTSQEELLIMSEDTMNGFFSSSGSPAFNQSCDIVYNACENNMLIVFKDGICKYTFNETEVSKTFELWVVTTENTYSVCGQYSKVDPSDWTKYRDNVILDNHLLTTSQLNTTLQTYYTKSQVDAISSTLQNYINSNAQNITRLRADYEERMLSTPKYHRANWLLDEVDQQGRVTTETSGSTPVKRFNSMWWAVKESKLITFYGIPDIYRESYIKETIPDSANSITVKFLISGTITTYKIEKKYTGDVQTDENLYLQVTRTDDQIDRVNSIMTTDIDTVDNPTMVGASVNKYTIDLSDNLDQFGNFSDIENISNVPLIIDPNLNIAPLMGDLKIIKCGGLLTNKTDYINLPNIFGQPALVLYGSLVDDDMYVPGGITLSMNEDDNLVITYTEGSGSIHSLVINNNISNDQIAAFLNSIIKNFNVIRDTNALSLLLSIFQCTVQFGGVDQNAKFFIRTNNTYQLHTNNNVPVMEITEL